MQKAFVVRASAGESLKNLGRSWSQAVDASEDRPLAALLAEGWRVASVCPMPGDFDSCCLVVLESGGATAAFPQPLPDVPLAALAALRTPSAPATARRRWDGETIPLALFGVG